MPKRRPVPRPKNTARDKAINAALGIAIAQARSQPDGPILVRRSSLGKAATADLQKMVPSKPKESPKPPNAIQLALKNAGLVPDVKVADPKPEETAPVSSETAKNHQLDAANKTVPSSSPAKAKSPKKLKKAKPVPKVIKKRKKTKRLAHINPVSDIEARVDRMRARIDEAAQFIARINYVPPDALLTTWSKNVARMADTQSAFQDLAKDYVLAIEAEWQRRNILARLDPDHFDWPSTKATLGGGAFGSIEHAEGILGYLGYHVGKSSELSAVSRQSLLSRVFEGSLPPINGPKYMEDWGHRGTPSRLRKMAESIASAVKSAKRRNHADYSVAIEHWEEDLQYLYARYYVDRFNFGWPRR